MGMRSGDKQAKKQRATEWVALFHLFGTSTGK
jgi:hypothetical protein